MSYATEVGQRMRDIREARGMNMPMVAEASGLFSAAMLGFWERGQKGIFAEDLAAYADFLGLPVTMLLPPEPDRDAALQAKAVRAVQEAVAGVAAMFATITHERARELLTEALKGAS